LIVATASAVIYIFKRRMSKINRDVNIKDNYTKKSAVKFILTKIKGHVDLNFIKELYMLLKIAVPKLIGRETISLVCLSALLVFRTVLSIQMSEINGSIVKAIVDVKPFKFIEQVKLYLFRSLL
jgi:hypothetical protein